MTDTLESLLGLVCKSVTQAQQNAQQTLYLLTDTKDAKLAYDLLIICGLDCKYFVDEHGAKLYVQNDSVAACEEKLASALASAPLFKHIKDTLDTQDGLGDYSISLTNTPAGRQFTLLLPTDKQSSGAAPVRVSAQINVAGPIAPKRPVAKKAKEEDSILSGPAVARKSIPKQFKTSDTEEDPLSKRIMLYMSGRAFTSGAWVMFVLLLLGIVFSLLVTIKGFMCPDVATDARSLPSYCPQKNVVKQEQ